VLGYRGRGALVGGELLGGSCVSAHCTMPTGAQVREVAERVQHSEQDAAAARVLAGGADRDVEQIRGGIRDFGPAPVSSFTTVRAGLRDLRVWVNDGFAQVDGGFAEMCGRLDATATAWSRSRIVQYPFRPARRSVDVASGGLSARVTSLVQNRCSGESRLLIFLSVG
jgi:hypothetical protein